LLAEGGHDETDWSGCAWGIGIARIKPGGPQQNGRHEHMHLSLKREGTRPASSPAVATAAVQR
jgi:hypothetical protein